jgi:hypothetical protein
MHEPFCTWDMAPNLIVHVGKHQLSRLDALFEKLMGGSNATISGGTIPVNPISTIWAS